MADKQAVITEAAEGVVPVSTRARAASAGVALHSHQFTSIITKQTTGYNNRTLIKKNNNKKPQYAIYIIKQLLCIRIVTPFFFPEAYLNPQF